jgi:hypothetical protein
MWILDFAGSSKVTLLTGTSKCPYVCYYQQYAFCKLECGTLYYCQQGRATGRTTDYLEAKMSETAPHYSITSVPAE